MRAAYYAFPYAFYEEASTLSLAAQISATTQPMKVQPKKRFTSEMEPVLL
jgi:hypothetical protein